MSDFFFDASEIDTTDDLLPVGEYRFIITDCELRDTQSKTGKFVRAVLEVVDGQHAGRKVFKIMNVKNTNSTAEEIGKKDFARMIEGVFGEKKKISSLDEFLNRTVLGKVKHGKDKNGDKRVDIASYKFDGEKDAPTTQKLDDLPF